jgi:hypothetical protein
MQGTLVNAKISKGRIKMNTTNCNNSVDGVCIIPAISIARHNEQGIPIGLFYSRPSLLQRIVNVWL